MNIKSPLAIAVFLVGTMFLAMTTLTLSYYYPYITSEQKLLNYKKSGITLVDRNNIPFFKLETSGENTYASSDQIPQVVKDAVVSSEDDSFYEHHGISLKGVVRAALLNLANGTISHGGSTITQQLVKNTLLTPERSFTRKYQEALLAFVIESKYSKDKILEMYLNSVYFGENAIGIQKAAERYFGKDAQDLTLPEASYLVGLLTAPSEMSPFSGDAELAEQAQRSVLQRMKNDGYITSEELELAQADALSLNPQQDTYNTEAQHFSFTVLEELKKMYGEEVVREGMTVRTSIDLVMQHYVDGVVKEHIAAIRGSNVSNASVVVMDPQTGEVLVMVGSVDWFNEEFGKINMATSPRQPGSSFKPIVYSIAFEERLITPSSVLHDRPTTFQTDYRPRNYDNRFRGNVQVRRALANSLNVPAVEVMKEVGLNEVLSRAPQFGITSFGDASNYGLSLVLGSGEVSLLEMVNAYSTFANKGDRPEPALILEVFDKYGKNIYSHEPKVTEVISEESAFLISSILSDEGVRREVFGNLLDTSFTTAVKTGTTENFRDAWTIGYTPGIVVGVWTGNSDNSPIYSLSGSLAAAPLWKQIITHLGESDGSKFQKPDGVVQLPVCGTGLRSASGSARLEYFIEGTEPRARCYEVPRPRIEFTKEDEQPGDREENNNEESEEERKRIEEERRKWEEARSDEQVPPIGGSEQFPSPTLTPEPDI